MMKFLLFFIIKTQNLVCLLHSHVQSDDCRHIIVQPAFLFSVETNRCVVVAC